MHDRHEHRDRESRCSKAVFRIAIASFAVPTPPESSAQIDGSICAASCRRRRPRDARRHFRLLFRFDLSTLFSPALSSLSLFSIFFLPACRGTYGRYDLKCGNTMCHNAVPDGSRVNCRREYFARAGERRSAGEMERATGAQQGVRLPKEAVASTSFLCATRRACGRRFFRRLRLLAGVVSSRRIDRARRTMRGCGSSWDCETSDRSSWQREKPPLPRRSSRPGRVSFRIEKSNSVYSPSLNFSSRYTSAVAAERARRTTNAQGNRIFRTPIGRRESEEMTTKRHLPPRRTGR